MTSADLYLIAGVGLFTLGALYLVLHRRLIGKILAINVAGSGVFLVFISVAGGIGTEPPDPVPHAMVLTGIVVAVSATAVALAFVSRLQSGNSAAGHPDNHDSSS